MFKQKASTVSTAYLAAMTLSLAPITIAQAQSPYWSPSAPSDTYQAQFWDIVVPAGTQIPLMSEETQKILVLPEETMAISLKVAENVVDDRGRTLIPAGTEVTGQIQPYGGGSRFVAQSLIFPNGRQQYLNAVSQVVTRTEVVEQGVKGRSIVQGTLVGAAAATVLAAITGDNAIATEEVLGGAGVGALGGWIFGPRRSQELISINPNFDLDITLQSDLSL